MQSMIRMRLLLAAKHHIPYSKGLINKKTRVTKRKNFITKTVS